MNVFTRRVRGFRMLDLFGIGLLVLIIVGVYLAKTLAGRERAEIAGIERQISDEKGRIRMLQAEVAHLDSTGSVTVCCMSNYFIFPKASQSSLTSL